MSTAPEAPEADTDAPQEGSPFRIETPPDAPLAVKVAHAMAEAGRVTKSSTNTEQNYKFASAEAILGAVRAPLLERGVLLLPEVIDLEEQEITARSGTKGTRVVLKIRFTFDDGTDELVRDWRGEGQDYGDKAYGKAYTNAVKTFVRSAWLLPTEHDDPEGSPSGERVGSTAAPELPPWARLINAEAGQKLTAELERAIPAEDVANLLGAIGTYSGGVPNVASRALLGLITRLERAGVIDPKPQPAPAGQDAAGEENQAANAPDPEAPAEPAQAAEPEELGPPPDAPTTPQPADPPMIPGTGDQPRHYDAWPTADQYVEDAAKAGHSLSTDEMAKALRAAGCICPTPLGDQRADACPFADHGIPF